MKNNKSILLLKKRFFAFLIDCLIILPIALCITSYLLMEYEMCDNWGMAIFTAVFLYINPLGIITGIPIEAVCILILSVFLAIIFSYVSYCFIMEFWFKGTLGQKTLKIEYENYKREKLNKSQIILRNILKLISLMLCLSGLATVIFSKEKRTLYDILTNTRPKEKQ